ncbi:hypothetical protein D3C77_329210 [compost metagenome]
MHYKMRHVYVGLDLHKAHHTAVIINCWHGRLGEIQIENKPSAFDELMKFVKKHTPKGMTHVYGLEDTGGKGKDQASGQGNRVLNSIFHNLAVQQIQVAKGDNKKQLIPQFKITT